MIPKVAPLPHERDTASKEWDEKYGSFTTINDELTKRWLETHYAVHQDEAEEKPKSVAGK